MHPEPHTDLDNLNTVQHNLRISAKGSNDAYDVTVSFTVSVSELVDDRSGQPDEIQANKIPKPKKIGNHDRTEQPVRFRDPGVAARSQGNLVMKFHDREALTPVLLMKLF